MKGKSIRATRFYVIRQNGFIVNNTFISFSIKKIHCFDEDYNIANYTRFQIIRSFGDVPIEFEQSEKRSERTMLSENKSKDIDKVKKELNKALNLFETSKTMNLDNTKNSLSNSIDKVEKLKTEVVQIPKGTTILQLEKIRNEEKNIGVAKVLRAFRSLSSNDKIFDVLREADKEHIHLAIHHESFAKIKPKNILRVLHYSKRTNLIKVYNTPTITTAVEKVGNYLGKLTEEEIASLAVLLDRVNLKEEK